MYVVMLLLMYGMKKEKKSPVILCITTAEQHQYQNLKIKIKINVNFSHCITCICGGRSSGKSQKYIYTYTYIYYIKKELTKCLWTMRHIDKYCNKFSIFLTLKLTKRWEFQSFLLLFYFVRWHPNFLFSRSILFVSLLS